MSRGREMDFARAQVGETRIGNVRRLGRERRPQVKALGDVGGDCLMGWDKS